MFGGLCFKESMQVYVLISNVCHLMSSEKKYRRLYLQKNYGELCLKMYVGLRLQKTCMMASVFRKIVILMP
jgi:hypothetical protein